LIISILNAGVLFYLIGCIGFGIVVLLSPARMELLALIYFGGLSSSFLYTGAGLKYIALGDIIIMITFGPVSVLYSFIAQTGTLQLFTCRELYFHLFVN
jgi:1,4-dihydroxy-2-naphthoate octaprenyltransferase